MMISQLQDEIRRLKAETDTAILAHSYQHISILEIADRTGDSYALSLSAGKLPQKTILLCGVRFMAQTVKMLCPDKQVILPVPGATCPMAEQISPKRVREFRQEHPEYKVVAYINTTAELKAECDVCVTSSSALKIVGAMPEKNILFIPDRNLGSYVRAAFPEKNILIWDGCCPIHNAVTEAECLAARAAAPTAKLLAHPELPTEVVRHADLVGSTADILNYARSHLDEPCIIGTENSIAETLQTENPHGTYSLLSKNLICPDMKMTTLVDVLRALRGEGGEAICMTPELLAQARRPIDAMIRLGSGV